MLNDINNSNAISYSVNGFDYKFVEEEDGWFSIYRYHYFNQKYIPIIQSKDIEHCKNYCDMVEPVPVPLERL